MFFMDNITLISNDDARRKTHTVAKETLFFFFYVSFLESASQILQ